MDVIKLRFYYFLFFSTLWSQNNPQQVDINILTTMDIAYAGKIFINTTQRASNGLYKEEVESKYEKFYVRMFAGGNKTVGKILSDHNQALTMYDKTEKKYSEELFTAIRSNNGIPTLKDVTKMEPGGGRGDNSSDTTRSNSQSDTDRKISRSISNNYININDFDCRKITTKISDDNGSIVIEEWVTSDTSLFSFVENELITLISSYGGSYEKPRVSSDWIKSIDPNKKIANLPGEIIKSSIVWKNDEGKNSFSMKREILSASVSSYNSKEFEISKKFKKVSELD